MKNFIGENENFVGENENFVGSKFEKKFVHKQSFLKKISIFGFKKLKSDNYYFFFNL